DRGAFALETGQVDGVVVVGRDHHLDGDGAVEGHLAGAVDAREAAAADEGEVLAANDHRRCHRANPARAADKTPVTTILRPPRGASSSSLVVPIRRAARYRYSTHTTRAG